jgi:hypothetical protein
MAYEGISILSGDLHEHEWNDLAQITLVVKVQPSGEHSAQGCR